MLMDGRTAPLYVKRDGGDIYELDEESYRKSVAAAFADFGAHPAFFCFYVVDEPKTATYAASCRAARVVRELTGREGFINLYPYYPTVLQEIGNIDYVEYLRNFADDSGCGILCHDYYAHMSQCGTPNSDFYYNLGSHLKVSREKNIAMWNIVNGSVFFEHKRMTKADLRYQMNVSLAYGSRGIMYFTFDQQWDHGGLCSNMSDAPLNRWGERTELYQNFAELHREFHTRWGKIFPKLRTVSAKHFPKPPHRTSEPFLVDDFVAGIYAEARSLDVDVIISNMVDGSTGDKYVFIVNASMVYNCRPTVFYTNAKKITQFRLDGEESLEAVRQDGERFLRDPIWLSPGQAQLFKLYE